MVGKLVGLLFTAVSAQNLLEEGTDFGFLDKKLPLVDTEKVQALIKPEALQEWAHKLWIAANASTESIGHPTRAIGTPGFNATIDMILDTLDELSDYYTYELQPFVVARSTINEWNITTEGGEEIPAQVFKMSPGADAEAPVSFIPGFGCLPSDYYNSTGTVAVVPSGECAFGMKAELAGLANASALLIYDPELSNHTEVKYGTLGTPTDNQVGTLGISYDSAQKLQAGDILKVYVNSTLDYVDTYNVIAETKGGDHDNVVFSGAHCDSVTVGPGINDNGSGLTTQLEVARQLANFRVKNAVRFAWWAAEENGLKGSLHYTENLTKRQAQKIRLFLDYDMLGSRNYVYEIYDSDDSENPKGSSALRDMYIDWYKSHGYNYSLQPFDGRSDYVGFVQIGIPSSGVDSGVEEIKTDEDVAKFGGEAGKAYDECYHLACDNEGNVNVESWLVNSKLVAHSVAKYAESLAGFPKRDLSFYEQRTQGEKRWSRNDFFATI